MFKNLFVVRFVLTILLAVPFAGYAYAQEPADASVRAELVDSISSAYVDWSSVSISGKLKMEGLPVSPSVKIYMERDSSVLISLRAPFMGEVGRAEIYCDTLLVVNKMKKTFVKEPLSQVLAHYPGTLSDVQNILLARPVIAGLGLLTPEIVEKVEIYQEADGQFSLLPVADVALEEFNYGYLVDGMARTAALLVLPLTKPDTMVSLTYGYGSKGYDLSVVYQSPDKKKGGTLELDFPDWNGSPVQPIKLNDKYTRLDFPDFMKSF